MAIVWKEISTKASGSKSADAFPADTNQVKRTTSSVTEEMLRVRRIWQLESKGATLHYDDEAG